MINHYSYSSGSSVHVNGGNVFINGRPAAQNLRTLKLNERKAVPFAGTTSLRIESSFADVRFFKINEQNVMAHLHGNMQLERAVRLELRKEGPVVVTSVPYNGSSASANGVYLDIFVPNSVLNNATINTSSANVEIASDFCIDQIMVNSASGNVSVSSKSKVINIQTMSGNINICFCLGVSANATVNSMSGNIVADASRVPTLQFRGGSQSGQVINNHRKRAGEVSYLSANTMSGSIIIS